MCSWSLGGSMKSLREGASVSTSAYREHVRVLRAGRCPFSRQGPTSRQSHQRVHGSSDDPSNIHQSGQNSFSGAQTALAIALASTFLPKASFAADVDSTVASVIEGVKAGGEAIKKGLDIVGTGVEVAKEGYDSAAPVVEDIVKKAAPVVSGAAEPVLKAATPSVEQSVKQAETLLSQSGVDVGSIKSGTGAAVSAATPLVNQFGSFLVTTSPLVLAEYAVGAYALYAFGPPLFRALLLLLKGYAGDATPAAALDAVETKDDTFLIDIRSLIEKETAGIPDLPRGVTGKMLQVEYAYTNDRRLRGQLRNAVEVECEITAMQIGALRNLSKSSAIFIMDRNGQMSKMVAKQLGRRGFQKCYSVEGGFAGWLACKLQIKQLTSVYRPEVIPPSLSTILGTGKRALPSSSPKALPPPTGSRTSTKKK